MNVADALECLGARRVIWIDDEFNEKSVDLAHMLVQHLDLALACDFPEIREIVQNYEAHPDTTEIDLAAVFDADPAAAERIQGEFLRRLGERESSQEDLSKRAIERICELLKIDQQDRWPFESADTNLPELCKDSADGEILYVVDLNDAVTDNEDRGLDVLVQLAELRSRGTAFLLTRETEIKTEADKEAELRAKLKDRVPGGQDLNIPTCVIAKERLFDQDGDGFIEEALRVAIKRAGLRRSIHEVLWRAEGTLKDSFRSAADSLTGIAPEKLESFVVEKGFREGVSELHVVERALTAHVARDIRELFGTDPALIGSAERMRRMRSINLRSFDTMPEEHLEKFRKAEIWEEPDLINSSLSPIGCGDVFEVFVPEAPEPGVKFLFVGQPCDIGLRSDGKRDQDSAIFIPLKPRQLGARSEGTMKKPLLPFMLDQVQYLCDFRSATPVWVAILDLASFRKDGLVQIDKGHSADPSLLPGQAAVYERRTKIATKLLNVTVPLKSDAASTDPKLQLTFATDGPYRQICRGMLHPLAKGGKGSAPPAPTQWMTWNLRRCGRIRMPYAAAILENYVNVMSRRAFEMDYTDLHLDRFADQHIRGSGI